MNGVHHGAPIAAAMPKLSILGPAEPRPLSVPSPSDRVMLFLPGDNKLVAEHEAVRLRDVVRGVCQPDACVPKNNAKASLAENIATSHHRQEDDAKQRL